MITNRLKALLLIPAVFALGQASAEESMIEYVMNACEGDLEQYCSQVTPGDGRLLYCVAAHGDKISGDCQYALFEAATVLAQMSDVIVAVADSCETEIDTLCGDVKLGEGRIVACLQEHDSDIGESCRAAVAEMAGE
jgi:hypothetical protein